MARYIDADKLNTRERGNNSQRTVWREIKYIVDNAPTADVVPKSEVERLERQLEPFKEVQCFTCKHYDIGHDHVPCYYCEDYNKYIWLSADADTEVTTSTCKETRQKVAREIFEEIERLMENNEVYFRQTDEMQEEFAELKKKYTEEKLCTDCKHFVGCECFSGGTCDQYVKKYGG